MKEPLYCQPACNARSAASLHSHTTCTLGLAQADVGMQGLDYIKQPVHYMLGNSMCLVNIKCFGCSVASGAHESCP